MPGVRELDNILTLLRLSYRSYTSANGPSAFRVFARAIFSDTVADSLTVSS